MPTYAHTLLNHWYDDMIHVTIIKVTIDNMTTSHITFGKMYALLYLSVTKICFNR
jgi:hypothetical protein